MNLNFKGVNLNIKDANLNIADVNSNVKYYSPLKIELTIFKS